MRLINITNSYSRMVSQQLANTDADYVKVYSLGKTTVIYTRAATHEELLLKNATRNVQKSEVEFALNALTDLALTDVKVIDDGSLVEVTIPTANESLA